MKKGIVVGLGQTGRPLFEILRGAFGSAIDGHDKPIGYVATDSQYSSMHVCLPFSDSFIPTVIAYQKEFNPTLTIIHSTVSIGTTSQIPDAVHSPILGDHTNMKASLLNFTKWIGGRKASQAAIFMEDAGMTCKTVETSEETEALKLMCLAKYGMSIAFSQYQKDICDKYGFSYGDVLEWDSSYNEFVHPTKRRPIMAFPGEKIGGHCVVPGTKLLNISDSNPMLEEVLRYE